MFSKAALHTFVYGTRIEGAKPPPLLKFRSSNAFIIATVALAALTDIFLYSVVVPVLPFALTVRAGVEEKDIQKWTSIFLSVYGAALAVGSPIFGWFADRTSSRRIPLLLGLLALATSTALLCIGRSLALLTAGRVLQGFSSAVVWTVGLALISDSVEKEQMGQAMGYVALAMSVGSISGPLLGGVVYAKAGYYAVFAMGFALVGLDILLRLVMIEKLVAAQWSLTNEAPRDIAVESQPPQATLEDEICPAPTQFAPHVESEKIPATNKIMQHLPPMIALLRIPRLLVSLFGCFVQATFLASFDSVLPLYVKKIFRWNSTGAGLIFICLVIPQFIAPFVGRFSDRSGPRVPTTIGLFGSIPFWVCLRFVTYDSVEQKVLLCAILVMIGFSLTLVMTPLMAEIDHVVELEEKRRPGSLGKRGAAAQAFGLFNAAYVIGTLVGPLWAGFLVQKAGWGTMGWSFGLLSGVAAISTLIWTGGRITLKGKEGGLREGTVV